MHFLKDKMTQRTTIINVYIMYFLLIRFHKQFLEFQFVAKCLPVVSTLVTNGTK